MPVIQPWQPSASIAPILQSLREGGCVVLPTESTYEIAASALRVDAVTRMQSLIRDGNTAALVLTEDAHLPDWMPWLRGAGLRLCRKLGPGPLLLRANGGHAFGLAARLPAPIRSLLIQDHALAVRFPAHPVWTDLRQWDMPLLSVPLPARTAQEAAELVGARAAYIVDAGLTEFGIQPSVVEAQGRSWQLQREGALSAAQIRELALCRILFICTGNTCRSPMAAALCAKLLADRLGCAVAELPEHGFLVQSAGLAAMAGHVASPEAVTALPNAGELLLAHRSRMVTMEMLAWADHIFTMTAGHWHGLMNIPVAGIPQPRLLSPHGADVADPIGGTLADYQECAQEILACLQQRLPELLES